MFAICCSLTNVVMANSGNFNYPLFLHPSDTPGMYLVNDQLLGVENYGVWSRAMLLPYELKKIAFIDGSYLRPSVSHASLYLWERCNALVFRGSRTLSNEIFGGIMIRRIRR